MKFQQIIFALNIIIQVLISMEYTLFNIIPKSLVTLQFLKFLIFQIKAYIQGFQMRYQSFLGHWYPNSYSWFSDSMDIPFVLISTVCIVHLTQFLYFYLLLWLGQKRAEEFSPAPTKKPGLIRVKITYSGYQIEQMEYP